MFLLNGNPHLYQLHTPLMNGSQWHAVYQGSHLQQMQPPKLTATGWMCKAEPTVQAAPGDLCHARACTVLSPASTPDGRILPVTCQVTIPGVCCSVGINFQR